MILTCRICGINASQQPFKSSICKVYVCPLCASKAARRATKETHEAANELEQALREETARVAKR